VYIQDLSYTPIKVASHWC